MAAEKTTEKKKKKLTFRSVQQRFLNAFALMSIIPLLIFLYILVSELFTFSALVGVVGLLFSLTIFLAILGYLLTHDIFTDIMIQFEKLKRLDKAKSDFLAIVSHDLKSPILVIKARLQSVLSGTYGQVNEEQKEILNLCQDVTERMNDLTTSLLKMHQVEINGMIMHRKLCNILYLVEKQIRELEPGMRQKGIKVEKQVLCDNSDFWADEEKIQQVINNLLSNAVKFTPENGLISLVISRVDDNLRLEVHNTGPHIPSDKLETIFDKYKKLDSTKKGFGLGLAITKNIINMHKGYIGVESDPETGTKFLVSLPCDLRKGRKRQQ